MASLVKELVEAGIHFGHRATNWNPKMAPFIFGKRNKIHIIDVKSTIKGLLLGRKFLTGIVASGKDVLFVGTKRQARACVEKHAREIEMPFVTERWLGGTLTNFRTIRERLKRLEELEHIEESGEINSYSKKMESQLRREKNKIKRNLDGIRNMDKLPGAMVVIDVSREKNALLEARKLGIPTVCLIDTDSDPDYADIPIPGNDDAMRSIDTVMATLCAAVNEGKTARAIKAKEQQAAAKDAGDKGGSRRRSSRAQFSAEDKPAPAPAPAAPAPAAPAAQAPAAPVTTEAPAAPEASAATEAPAAPEAPAAE